ncbi:GNAT family N-acetyltransferase [Photorhabdus antumapuensis]|uniref:GNAT family N-acetyltransferase n=1 Tax=Photorhabdus antumapuensis TaxID=2862867 RepID=UPI001CECA961|nr:GNAT family N-acetyltransferase [Photorhabdus antumapuensis]
MIQILPARAISLLVFNELIYFLFSYANEAARKALDFAFTQLKLEEIVAFTTISNLRSQKVMERLGMVKDENTFLHPSLPNGHPLHEHVLYRIRQ